MIQAGVAVGGLGALSTLPFIGSKAFAQNKKPKQDFAGQTLRIFVYSGAWEDGFRKAFVPMFKKKTGAKVVLDPGWWDSIPKLKASPKGKPAFDLVLTDATQGYPGIKEGLFQKINLKQVTNVKDLAPSTLEHWVYNDSYGVPFPDSAMTLSYNSKLTGKELTGWKDLLDPKLRGKLGMYNSFYMSLFTFACMKADLEGKAGTAHQMMTTGYSDLIAFVKEQKKHVKYWWPTSTDMVVNLAQKGVAAGNMHSNSILTVLKEKPELKAIVPSKDQAFVQLMWVVPSGTQRKDLAEVAINEIFSEGMQIELAKAGGASTSHTKAATKLAAQDPVWSKFYPSTTEAFKTLQYYPYDAYFKKWDEITELWDKQIIRS